MSESAVLGGLETTPEGLLVYLDEGAEPVSIPWFWVRDHSRDPASFNETTGQRTVDSFAIDLDQAAISAHLEGEEILVEWSDGTARSVLPLEVVRALRPVARPVRLWRDGESTSAETIQYQTLMDEETVADSWIGSIETNGFALVEGVPTSIEGAESLAKRVGYVRRTVFGDMWTLSSEVKAHADSAYDSTFIGPHTDGSYCHDAPGLQMFVCSERSGEGGESILVDGSAAAEALRLSNPEAFVLLSTVDVPAHYLEDGVDLRALRPTLGLTARGEIRQVTFNNYDRSPFLLAPGEMRKWYEAYSAFNELLNDRSAWWVHRLEPGEGVLFDNWRCLHGRMSYTGTRVFHGCYLNHEDLESKLRLIDGAHI